MKKFFLFVLSLLGILFFGLMFIVFCHEIFVKHHYEFKNCFGLFVSVFVTLGGILQMVDVFKQTDNPETETNIDKPKESDDVVVVTEIQGERKIIKNGKVIYSEKLKADELKVFENLKDKN
jgi:hypothetical protein